MVSKVNVFLVGAQKAGTTSLYDWLGQHAEIDAPSEIKDYHFFNNDEYFSSGYGSLEKYYNKESRFKVHSAVNYLYFHEKSARRIYEYNPNAKIVICLRNPVDRAISAYKYCVGTLKESLDFSDALNRELNSELNTFSELSNNSYISHGFYVEQIEGYLKYFDISNIFFVFFSEINDLYKRKYMMKSLCEFLGCDSGFEFNYTHRNFSGRPKSVFLNKLVRNSTIGRFLGRLLPYRLRKKIGKKVNLWNIGERSIQVEINDEDVEILKRVLRKKMPDFKDFFDGKNYDELDVDGSKSISEINPSRG